MTTSPTSTRSDLHSETIIVLGVSTSGADGAEGRELALGPDDVVRVRDRISAAHPELEQVIIATCDRTELVLAARTGVDARLALDIWHRSLGVEFTGDRAPCLAVSARPFLLTGSRAIEHILRVACGLESSILGDADILGQLRSAWHQADDAGTTGRITSKVFRDAFATGRRARSSTEISAGGAGVGSAVAAAVGSRTGPVLIVGAGPAGRTIARRLAKQTTSPITIANRTLERARALASEIDGRIIEMDALDDALLDADVVVTAVASPRPVLTSCHLDLLRGTRPEWSPLIIDVGAPANVEPHDDFEIISLDGLAQRTNAMTQRRNTAVPLVEQIINDVLGRRYRTACSTTDTQTINLADFSSAATARRSSLS